MKIRALILAVLIGAAGANGARAETPSLKDRIIAAGTSAIPDRKTGVRLNGCEINTFVHVLDETHGWILYSSFTFNLQLVELRRLGDSYTLKLGDDTIVRFLPTPPYAAELEVPVYRYPRRTGRPSEREAGVDYKIIQSYSFFVRLKGPEAAGKAAEFAEALLAYKNENCRLIG